MYETTDRLLLAKGWDHLSAFAAITEAVWWVTMVDATLVRYHPSDYSAALATHDRSQRKIIEDTLGGLRFVRNRMGYEADHEDFIQPSARRGHARRIAEWTWRPVSPPAASLHSRGQEWEMNRHQAYQAQLAGETIGDTFSRTSDFIRLTTETSVANS